MWRICFVLCVCVLSAACASKPPGSPRTATPSPAPTATAAPLPSSLRSHVDAGRAAREITLRIRNIECGGIAVGSAVAIGPRLLATNRHVVDGARSLEIQTWDGRTVSVHAVEEASDQDLGLVRVDDDLPAIAQVGQDPRPGDNVSAVGFPEAGPFQQLDGHVVDYVDGSVFGEARRIMRVTIPVEHGNSGGAVLNDQGQMVGIIFAIETRSGFGLAIPASSLTTLLDAAAFYPIAAC